jgi:hypothetical protein
MLTFLTSWLLLPILLFCPLALYFAAKSYSHVTVIFPNSTIAKIVALTPMLIAIAAVPLSFIFINQNYQA